MKWCVQFPEEEILIMRPCLRRACTGNKHAAALLSYLLYHVSISQEFKKSTEQHIQSVELSNNGQSIPASISICKTQQQILTDMDHDISERTLRSIAIPLLVEHGYIDIDSTHKSTQYTIHLKQIQTGILAPHKKAAILPVQAPHIQSGNFAASYRQDCRQLPADLPPHTGKVAEFGGRFAGVKNADSSAPEALSTPTFCADKSKSNKDITKRREEAPKTTHSEIPGTGSQKASASHPQEKKVTAISSKLQDQPETTGESVQHPDLHDPGKVETVLQLIESLRGQRFSEVERQRQTHGARVLLDLQPALHLKDIQEAWLHGSDAYWKKHHDSAGMTVLDLANYNSNGKRRILATLEHRRQQRSGGAHPSTGHALETPLKRSDPPTSPMSRISMTKQEAQQLAEQIKRDGGQHSYSLQAKPLCRDATWLVHVQIEQHKFTIQSLSEWIQRLPHIQQVMLVRKGLDSTEKKEQNL